MAITKRKETTYEIYEKHKHGATIKQLSEEYGISMTSINKRIRDAKCDEETRKRMTEFQRRFELNTARRLMRNDINTEHDLFEVINGRVPVRNIGVSIAEEISSVIGVDITAERINHNTVTVLKYGKRAYKEKKVRVIHGNFCGTVDGSPISGIIEGEFLPL